MAIVVLEASRSVAGCAIRACRAIGVYDYTL